MKSVFTDKKTIPGEADLQLALGDTYSCWQRITAYTEKLFPAVKAAWHYSGDKYGWSFRMSDQRRVLVYLLPRYQFFKTAFVFGQKATDIILGSNVSGSIKDELMAAKVYAEGRGIRIDVRDEKIIGDIEQLIRIKTEN